MSEPAPKKTVLEVLPSSYVRVKEQAEKAGQSSKRFTSMLLDYALQKLEAGQIELVEPTITDASRKRKEAFNV